MFVYICLICSICSSVVLASRALTDGSAKTGQPTSPSSSPDEICRRSLLWALHALPCLSIHNNKAMASDGLQPTSICWFNGLQPTSVSWFLDLIRHMSTLFLLFSDSVFEQNCLVLKVEKA